MHRVPQMDMKRMERRRSNSSIDNLRRELRNADKERFYMQAAVNSAADGWLFRKPAQPAVRRRSTVIAIVASTAGVCLLLLGGLIWRRLDTQPSGREGRPVTVASEPVDARIVDRPDNPVPQTVAPAPQTFAVRGRGAVAPAQQKSGRRSVSAERNQTKRPVSVAPRPLSPGEFGRTPSR